MNELYINGRFLTQKITGVQRYGIEIVSRIVKLIPTVVLTPPGIIHEELAEQLNAQTIGVTSSHYWEQIELPFYLKSKGSPLLFSYNGLGPIFYPNKIITIHDVSFLVNPTWFSFSYALFYRTFTSVAANNSKRIITVSNFSKKEIIKYLKISKRRIDVIYNAVNMSQDEISEEPIIKDKYILTVSSLDPRKNLNTLIKAFKYLNNKDLKLVVVGTTGKIFRANISAGEEDNIIFYGHANERELINLYKSAEAFVFPSLYEGFGLPPLEAMSLGAPVICSDIGSLKEVCGNAAVYFNPSNEKDLAEKINLLLNNQSIRRTLTEQGRLNLSRFSWDLSSRKLINIIDKLHT